MMSSLLPGNLLTGLPVAGVLPSMISRRTGHLLLVNSIQGKLTVPFRTTCEFTEKSLMPPLAGCRITHNPSPTMLAEGTFYYLIVKTAVRHSLRK